MTTDPNSSSAGTGDIEQVASVVDVDWLDAQGRGDDVVVVDATVHLPDTGRDARAEYLGGHIPGAVFFDLAKIADSDNPLPRKAPPKEVFAEKVGQLGIGDHTHVVAYDALGLYSAARVWWLFRLFGHPKVSVLDGGLKEWTAHGRPLASGNETRLPVHFSVRERLNLLATWQDTLGAANGDGHQILDARTAGRFAGTEEDRYPGTRPGHIPRSLNLYWGELLDPERRTLLPVEEIDRKLRDAGLDPAGHSAGTLLTCGSGLTACILALGMDLTGRSQWRVYDGSWDEWGRRHDLPVESAPPTSPE